MRSVFEASTGLEAHMVLNLLQQEGIDGRVDGEYLQSGVGELPAINVVRVVVDESDYERATTIISAWEAKQVDRIPEKKPALKFPKAGLGFLLGLFVGIGGAYWAYNSPVATNGVDYNHDGEIDEQWTYKDNRLARVDVDRNKDGNIDLIHKYDRYGIVYLTESDDDFDGTYETKYKYRYGNPYIQESDTNQDGWIDYRAFFKNGVLDEIEILDPNSKLPRKKQVYAMNKLVSAQHDTDGDGTFDLNYEYDYYEEINTESRISVKSDTR